MRKTFFYGGVIAISFAAILFSCTEKRSPEVAVLASADMQPSPDSMIRRGKYLVTIMGCNDCHTPLVMTPNGPMPDSSRMLSGHPSAFRLPPADAMTARSYILFSPTLTAMSGPWGTSFAANITSDATGIGNWTEAQFFKAIRKGLYKGMEGNRQLLPPMPWPNFAQASDEDLSAIFAYLKSTPPVENRVPAALPPSRQ